jgi:hypothetical protein
MEDNQSPEVEKRAILLCIVCGRWQMGGVKTRECDECVEEKKKRHWIDIVEKWSPYD